MKLVQVTSYNCQSIGLTKEGHESQTHRHIGPRAHK